MSFFNLYAKSVSNGTLGSPALKTDITDGFFKFSLSPATHSAKAETTYADVIGCLVVNDSIWEIYEGGTGDPILLNKLSGNAYNALSDVVITKRRDAFSIDLICDGQVAPNTQLKGLAIREERNAQAVNITDFNHA